MSLVAPAGFEPAISALRGLRPSPLDDGAIDEWLTGPTFESLRPALRSAVRPPNSNTIVDLSWVRSALISISSRLAMDISAAGPKRNSRQRNPCMIPTEGQFAVRRNAHRLRTAASALMGKAFGRRAQR